MQIVANDVNKKQIDTIIAAVITTNTRLTAAPGDVLLHAKRYNLSRESIISVSQIITIDESFFSEKTHSLANKIIGLVDEGLQLALKL